MLVEEWHKCREGEEGEGWRVCFGSLWSGVAVYRWLGLCGGFDANLALSLKIGTSAGDCQLGIINNEIVSFQNDLIICWGQDKEMSYVKGAKCNMP